MAVLRHLCSLSPTIGTALGVNYTGGRGGRKGDWLPTFLTRAHTRTHSRPTIESPPPPHTHTLSFVHNSVTTLPITTLDDQLQIIDYSVTRWTVEIYFRTLKSGCQVEKFN